MEKFELKIKSSETDKGEELFNLFNSLIKEEGLIVESAEEEMTTGMVGSEIIISIVLSTGTSILANHLYDKIKSLTKTAKKKTEIEFEIVNRN